MKRRLVRKKKKRGFTLIELLAVILILGIIALIAIPTVNNVISQARKGANEQTTNGYVKAAEQKCHLALMNNHRPAGIYDISELEDDVRGNKDLEGYYEVDKNCNVKIVVTQKNDTSRCYTKDFGEGTVSSYELDEGETCLAEKKEVSERSCFRTSDNETGLTIDEYLCGGKVVNYADFDLENINTGSDAILDYTTTDKMDVVIPSVIDGKPVTEIGSFAFSPLAVNISTGEFIVDKNKEVLIKSVVIPSSVEVVRAAAFLANIMSDVTISYGVEGFEDYSFAVNKLRKVYIPNSVTSISNYAFAANQDLASVYLSNNIKIISKSVFMYDDLSEGIKLPSGITTIDHQAFAYTNLKSITIPGTVAHIDTYAFDNSKVKNVVLEEGVTSIEDYVFGWSDVESITLPSTLTKIGASAFESSNLKKINFSEGLVEIGSAAFFGTKLESVTLPNSVKTIGYKAFASSSLKTVKFGTALEKISDYAFDSCHITGTVVIPDKVTDVGVGAFINNDISKFVLGKKVTNLGVGSLRILIHEGENSNTKLTSVVNNSGKAFEWAWVFYWYHDTSRVFETGTFSQPGQVVTVITKD